MYDKLKCKLSFKHKLVKWWHNHTVTCLSNKYLQFYFIIIVIALMQCTQLTAISTSNEKFSYCRDSVRCVKWPFKVTQNRRMIKIILCCANRRGIYDFLLASNSNLISIFNRSGDIMPSLHLSIPHLSSMWNWKKTAGNRWPCFGVRVPRTLDYPIAGQMRHVSDRPTASCQDIRTTDY